MDQREKDAGAPGALTVSGDTQPAARVSASPAQARGAARGGAVCRVATCSPRSTSRVGMAWGAEPLRDLWRGVDVDFDQLDLARQVAGELLERGADHAARSAPGCPQVGDDGDLGGVCDVAEGGVVALAIHGSGRWHLPSGGVPAAAAGTRFAWPQRPHRISLPAMASLSRAGASAGFGS
jgi:hypothetical protein